MSRILQIPPLVGKLVKGHKGSANVVFAGYRYAKSNEDKDKTTTYWRCVKRDVCGATLVTEFYDKRRNENLAENSEIAVIKLGRKPHTHEIESEQVIADDIVRGIKRRATAHPNEPPLQILQEELQNVRSTEVLVRLPERRTLFRQINRVQNRQRPVNPRSLEELIFREPYTKTLDSKQFLQYDSGPEDQNRIVLFYVEEGLIKLCASRSIDADGTFKVVPQMFGQMYTMHGEVGGHVFPLVYCLTVRRTQETYDRIFQHLKQHATRLGQQLQPDRFVVDFELAAINSVRAVFPEAVIQGCLFHLTENIWRRAVLHGLKVNFKKIKKVLNLQIISKITL